MKHTLLIALVLSVILPVMPEARTWYVEPDSTGQVINIQAGIDSCAHGDTVLVAPGIFRGDGNRDLDFRGKPILVISEMRFDPTVTDSTVIDCEGTWEDPHGGFHFHSGETRDAVLEGFVIENGAGFVGDSPCTRSYLEKCLRSREDAMRQYYNCYPDELQKKSVLSRDLETAVAALQSEFDIMIQQFDTYPMAAGGAIRCDSASSPTLRNNLIRSCIAFLGGGIACFDSLTSPIITGNTIENCAGYQGGGIVCINSSPVIKSNIIQYNHASNGGGIDCSHSTVEIKDNVIIENDACSFDGGGISCYDCPSITISDNYIYRNGAHNTGGALWVLCSTAIIDNNVISNNSSNGAGCMDIAHSSLQITNNEINHNIGKLGVSAIGNSAAEISNNYFHSNWCMQFYSLYLYSSDFIEMHDNEMLESQHDGGCVYYSGDSSSIFRNNTLIGSEGIGISTTSSITIESNCIKNHASSYGGGILCSDCSPLITGNLITNNTSGITCWSASPYIINNTIAFNTARAGGGIYIDLDSSPLIEKNIIAFNMFDCDPGQCAGGGIYTENPDVEISCNDVYGNDGGDYIGIPDQTGINGNFSNDPIFCDAENGIYTIHLFSPCMPQNHPYGGECGLIGAFDSDCSYIASLLQGFDASLDGGTISISWEVSEMMKVDEFIIHRAESEDWEYRPMLDAEISGGGTKFACTDRNPLPGKTYIYRVDLSSIGESSILFKSGPVKVPALPMTLRQNYPNPFNPATVIDYYVPVSGPVRLEVYDVAGRSIIRLVDEYGEAGSHSVEWNGCDNRGVETVSGAYFYRLTAGKEILSRKMVLLK